MPLRRCSFWGAAQDTVGNANDAIAGVQTQLNFAVANVDSALANSNASAAVLSESDLAGVVSDAFAGLLSKPGAAALAQTGNMSPSLLALLQE